METELLLTSSKLVIKNLFRLAALIQAEILVGKLDVMKKVKKRVCLVVMINYLLTRQFFFL